MADVLASLAARSQALPEPRDRVLPIECRGVAVTRRGRALLDRVDFDVGAGGVTVLMGPNGAGKSLLLRVLANLVAPDRGAVRWAGASPDRPRAQRLGFVFQKPVMLRRSVTQNLTFALAAAGVPRRARAVRVGELLALASLSQLARSPARVLSGGEQQRLAIARALVGAARGRGVKILLVTHDVGQGRRLADEVVFLHQGCVTERTPASRFFDQPASEPARAFLDGRLFL
jgi:tungstate transport system ATP-binding protein